MCHGHWRGEVFGRELSRDGDDMEYGRAIETGSLRVSDWRCRGSAIRKLWCSAEQYRVVAEFFWKCRAAWGLSGNRRTTMGVTGGARSSEACRVGRACHPV
jgi:hypothetical protein